MGGGYPGGIYLGQYSADATAASPLIFVVTTATVTAVGAGPIRTVGTAT